MDIEKEFNVDFINKKTGEIVTSTNSTMSSLENDKRVRLPKVLEIKNTEGNSELYEQLLNIDNGTYHLELEGMKVGKYNLTKVENVIRLVEVLK